MSFIPVCLRRSAIPLAVALLLCASLTKAQAAEEASRVHILLVIDTHAEKIGAGMAVNRDHMRQVINEVYNSQWPKFRDRIFVNVLEDDKVTPQFIRDYYRSLPSDANDTLAFYYCGHGATDRQKGHYLAMSGGSILRSEIRDLMRKKSPRLAVLLTDCCSSFAEFQPPPRRRPASWKAFFQLFFQHTGVVDIQAASTGEFGWSSDREGGFFTRCLTRLLCEPVENLDDNDDGFVSWNEFYGRLRRDTLDVFAKAKENARPREDGGDDIRNSAAQTPQSFYLAQWPAEYRRRLRVVNQTGEALCVWVQYYTLDQGEWSWFYPTSQRVYYELAPGQSTYLRDSSTGWKIDAHDVRIWAAGTRSRKVWTHYKNQNLVLTPQAYNGPMGTFTYTFYP